MAPAKSIGIKAVIDKHYHVRNTINMDIFEKVFKSPVKNPSEKPKEPVAVLEKAPFEAKMNQFVDEVKKKFPPDADDDLGKGKSYVDIKELYPIYKEIFEGEEIAERSVAYRLSVLNKEGYGEDVLTEEGIGGANPKHFINCQNKQLLTKLFIPRLIKDENLENAMNDIDEVERMLEDDRMDKIMSGEIPEDPLED